MPQTIKAGLRPPRAKIAQPVEFARLIPITQRKCASLKTYLERDSILRLR